MRRTLHVSLLAVLLFVLGGVAGIGYPAWAQEGSTISVTPASLAFTYTQTGALPSAQNLAVSSRRTTNFNVSLSQASWLTVNKTSGTTPSTIAVSANPGTLAAGTYTATITISSRRSTVRVPVTLTVQPSLVVSPTSLSFTYQQGGSLPASQSVSVSATSGTLNFTDSASGGSWLSVNSASGTTPGSIGVSVNPGTLSAGTYTGSVTISSSTGSKTIPVTLTVVPSLVVSPTSLSFTYQQGGSLPAPQTVSVSATSGTLSFTDSASGGSWLSVNTASGTTPASIGVSVNPGTLSAGTYTASVTVSSTSGSKTIPVTLTVKAAPATLVVSPTSLSFTYQQGGSLPSSKTLSVTASSGTLSFTDSKSASWLSVNRTSGTTPSSIGVSVNPGSLSAGTYTGSVTVSSSAGSTTIPVTLSVTGAAASLAVSPASLAFTFQQGGSNPSSQSLSVTASSGTLSFTDSASGGSWLSVNRTSGTTPSSIGVSVSPGSLSAGTYTGSVTVSSSGGSRTVPVTLTITASSGGGGGGGTSGTYVLMAWGELGMHCMDGKDYSVFSVLPPYNTLYAKLLTKGSQPVPVTSGVTITYQAMKDAAGSINTTSYGNSTVAKKTNFWDYVRTLFLGQPAPDVGLHNYPVQSLTPQPMSYDSTKGLWQAEGVPTVPYDDAGASNAYPMIQVIAKDSSGNTLATTTAVLAVSDEMSCKNCHAPNTNSAAMPSGGWITQYSAAQNIKLNILKKHDDDHPIPASVLSAVQAKGYTTYQSSLYQTALNGGALNNPVLCASCHQSNALNAAGMSTGVTGVPQLTVAMHQQHSTVTLPGGTTTLDNATDPANSCYQCHPGVNTKCQRGTMANIACFNCHGNLSRVSQPTRAGWLDEPNCQMCHQNGTTYTTAFTSTDIGPTGTQRTSADNTFATNANVPSTGFSLYRFSQGHGSTQCSACHGSQHAEFPTNQPNDNVSSTNLQGYPGRLTECASCHGTAQAVSSNGGPHGMHTVGQAWVSSHPNYAQSNKTACAYCHGSDYRGTTLSQLLTTKTLNGKTFAAGHQMNCYDCHNGPNP